MTRAEYRKILKSSLETAQALLKDALPPVEPPPPAPPARPAPWEHQAYINHDLTMCCQWHDDAFERSARPMEMFGGLPVQRLELPVVWLLGRDVDPPPPTPGWAKKPPASDTSFVQDLRRRAVRWFGRP
jgi:hypothetical protein